MQISIQTNCGFHENAFQPIRIPTRSTRPKHGDQTALTQALLKIFSNTLRHKNLEGVNFSEQQGVCVAHAGEMLNGHNHAVQQMQALVRNNAQIAVISAA
jgi:hypothetical protein